MKKINCISIIMGRRGILLPIVVFLILGIAAVFPLLVSMTETTSERNQYSEEWARIQWAIEGANQKQVQSNIADPYSGVVTTIANFTYPEGGGSFDVAVILTEGRTLLGRHRHLSATAKAYRNGVDAGYNLSGLAAANVSVPGVAAGAEHSFAWKKDGKLYSWGRNNYGRLGLGNTSSALTPQQTLNGASYSHDSYYAQGWMVAGGGEHTLALDYYGNVYSWGRNNRGQLGHSAINNSSYVVPQTVISGGDHLKGVSDLAAGNEFSLALTNSGNVLAWGDDLRGQLGYDPVDSFFNPADDYTGAPVTVVGVAGRGSSLQNIVGIAAGARHALAIDKAGNIFGWGDHTYGQLGAGLTGGYSRKTIKVNDTVATLVAEIPFYDNNKNPAVNSTQVNLSVGHFVGSFSVDMDRVYEADYDNWLGGYDYDVIRLRNVASSTNYDIIPISYDDDTPGRYIWQYDKNQTTDSYILDKIGTYTVKVVNKKKWLSWFSYKTSETELNDNWFKNSEQNNRGVYKFHGRPIEEPTDFFGIAAGGDFSMAVRRDGANTKLYTWGRNDQGQLGHGDKMQRDRVAPIVGFPLSGERIRTIAAGREHALALTESGMVYSWGRNNNGQLGSNNTTDRTSPAQITHTIGSVKITGIAAGAYHSLAVDEDGKVYAWGLKTYGRVGNGSTSGNQTTPVQLSGFP